MSLLLKNWLNLLWHSNIFVSFDSSFSSGSFLHPGLKFWILLRLSPPVSVCYFSFPCLIYMFFKIAQSISFVIFIFCVCFRIVVSFVYGRSNGHPDIYADVLPNFDFNFSACSTTSVTFGCVLIHAFFFRSLNVIPIIPKYSG